MYDTRVVRITKRLDGHYIKGNKNGREKEKRKKTTTKKALCLKYTRNKVYTCILMDARGTGDGEETIDGGGGYTRAREPHP